MVLFTKTRKCILQYFIQWKIYCFCKVLQQPYTIRFQNQTEYRKMGMNQISILEIDISSSGSVTSQLYFLYQFLFLPLLWSDYFSMVHRFAFHSV